MKNKLIFILLSVMLFFACENNSNCINGEGAIITQTISIESFTGVNLSGAHNIIISQGAVQKVEVTGNANIIDKLETNIIGDIWQCKLKDDCYNHYELTVHITIPTLTSVKISGSGNISVNDFDNQGNLFAEIAGSGNISLKEFNGCQNFTANIIGSGHISGTENFDDLENLTINIIGSGNFNGFPVETKNCTIIIEGSGNCFVYVEDFLDVNIIGSGSVFYKGTPAINVNISGSGSVIDSN